LLRIHKVSNAIAALFRSPSGIEAVEIDGTLEVFEENLGFGIYSATDRSLRFPKEVMLPEGKIQINDPIGTVSWWTTSRDGRFAWVTKDLGAPDIPHEAHVQIIRSVGGRLSIRRPWQ
jgi:hypothetical protein